MSKKGLTVSECLFILVILAMLILLGKAIYKCDQNTEQRWREYQKTYKYSVHVGNWFSTNTYHCYSYEISAGKYTLFDKKHKVLGGGGISDGWSVQVLLNKDYEEK